MKTTATLLIAIFMISTLSVISAGAYTADEYTTAVLEAADRLVDEQHANGGFRWRITDSPSYTSHNTLGVTAIGILKAHGLDDKTEYETALAKAYGFVVTYSDVDSWPDIPFLIELADAADKDASLLAAINAEVSGTTVAGIAALAKTRYDGGLLATYGPTATEMAEWLLGFRAAYPGYGFWEVRSIVKACLSLESYYPSETYDYYSQAQEAAAVIYANLDGGTYPFYIGDETQTYYVIGISGAIEAFSELGIHPAETLEMTELLIGFQSSNGYWDRCGLGGQESVQGTAYAIMALLAQGDEDAIASALEGCTWLVDTQDTTGGWDPCYLGGVENLEVDSEAAWALARARFMVRAIGQFTTNFDWLGSGTGHRCFINLHARQVADGWTGKGIFRDKDYKDGELKAVFTVESASVENLPRQINYAGTADIYIDKEYQANYVWESIIAIGEPFEIFSFQIRGQGLDYYAWANGYPSDDVSVEMTLAVLD